MSDNSHTTAGPFQADQGTSTRASDIQGDSWFAVGSIALGVFAFVTSEFIPVGVIPEIASELQVSLGTAGLMLTIPGLISAVSAPLLILAGGRIDRRAVLLALSGLLLVSNVLSSVAPNFSVMLVGRMILGCCLGGFWTVALAAGVRLVLSGSATRSISIIMSGMTCATVIGLPLGAFVGALLTWRASFLVTSALAAAALGAQVRFLPRLPSQSNVNTGDFLTLLRCRPMQAGLGLVALLFGSNIASYTYLAPFLRTDAGLARGALTPILLIFGIVGFLANLAVVPLLATRLRSTLRLLTGFMMVCMFAMPMLAHLHAILVLLLAVWAISFGAMPLCLNELTKLSASQLPEAVSALFVSTVQLSIALSLLAAAATVASVGLPANFWLGATLAAFGLLLVSLPTANAKEDARTSFKPSPR